MASPRTFWVGSIAFAALAALPAPAEAQQARFRPGDRVLCQLSGAGEWLPGTVEDYDQRDLELEPAVRETGRYYRVRLDNRPPSWQPDTCLADYTRPIGGGSGSAPSARESGPARGSAARPSTSSPTTPRTYAPRASSRPISPQATTQPSGAGGPAPRNLRGTAWKIESPGSAGVQTFLFCNSGRWEIVGSQLLNGGVSPVGTYTQAGSRLTTRNQDDDMVTEWTLAWPGGDRLDADDGRVTLRLKYNGRTTC